MVGLKSTVELHREEFIRTSLPFLSVLIFLVKKIRDEMVSLFFVFGNHFSVILENLLYFLDGI